MQSLKEADLEVAKSQNQRYIIVSLFPERPSDYRTEVLLSRREAVKFAAELLAKVSELLDY